MTMKAFYGIEPNLISGRESPKGPLSSHRILAEPWLRVGFYGLTGLPTPSHGSARILWLEN